MLQKNKVTGTEAQCFCTCKVLGENSVNESKTHLPKHVFTMNPKANGWHTQVVKSQHQNCTWQRRALRYETAKTKEYSSTFLLATYKEDAKHEEEEILKPCFCQALKISSDFWQLIFVLLPASLFATLLEQERKTCELCIASVWLSKTGQAAENRLWMWAGEKQ